MAKKQEKAPRVYRDALTGRFVTKKHPKRTVKERRRVAANAEDSAS